jgi:hypothetical protein
VLRGLEGIEGRLGSFAALIEISHLPETDVAWILERYTVELFEMRTRTLVHVSAAHPQELSKLLTSGAYHANDAVLRPRS